MVLTSTIPSLDDVGDPSDWPAGCEVIKALDSSLRCDLCFDIFSAPVSLKTCAHTFCSTCIRTHINQPGSAGAFCPKCRQNKAYDSELLPVAALETTAESWRKVRPFVMQLWKRAEHATSEAERLRRVQRQAPSRGSGRLNANGKRRAPDDDERRDEQDGSATVLGDEEEGEGESSGGAGRRRSNRVRAQQRERQLSPASVAAQGVSGTVGASADSAYILSDDDHSAGDASYTDPSEDRANGRGTAPDDKSDHELKSDDQVTCPICEHLYTVAALNAHLDRNKCYPGCPPPTAQERGIARKPRTHAAPSSAAWFSKPGSGHLPNGNGSDASASTFSSSFAGSTSSAAAAGSKRLHRPQYSLKSERDLRKLLEGLGLPTQGDKEKLVERHRQYVNLFNANLDAAPANQKSQMRLRRELTEWERARDARGAGALTDRRSQSWLADNRMQYNNLIAQARETAMRDRQRRQRAASPPSSSSLPTAAGQEELPAATASAVAEGGEASGPSTDTARSSSVSIPMRVDDEGSGGGGSDGDQATERGTATGS